MSVKATLIELWKRVVKSENNDDKIYINGYNNLYPNEVERVINNSPTAKRSALMMAKYISGDGLIEETQNIIINDKKKLTKTDIISKIGLSISYQYGAFIHINYGFNNKGELVPVDPEVLDYLKCRISKEDDNENPGKIYYKDYESKKTVFSSLTNKRWFYPFNLDQDVIIKQIENDFNIAQQHNKEKKEFSLEEGIKTYRGQVYYLNLSPYIYSLSPIDSAFNDADSEYRISLYTNKQTRSGFLGKTIIITNGLDEEKEKEIDDNISDFLGSENSDNVWHLNIDTTEDIDNVLKIEQIKAQFDDKLFTETTTRIRKNILGAFNNIPEALVFSGEGALFSTSGESYKEMKKFYSEQTKFERKKVEQTMNMLGFECEIKEIGADDL